MKPHKVYKVMIKIGLCPVLSVRTVKLTALMLAPKLATAIFLQVNENCSGANYFGKF